MDRRSNRDEFIPAALFKFDNIEKPVQNHLKKVYGCLAVSMLTACAGAYVHLYTAWMQASILTSIASIGLMIWLAATRHSKENEQKRLMIFSGFAFCTGMSLGPLLDHVIAIDPSIVVTALMATTVIFVSFSLAALYNNDRTFLYMGGFLLTALSWLILVGLLNIFFRSTLIWELYTYAGLFIFCAFVLYDTQLIVEKRRMGDEDYIWHSVDLFLDFIQIFRKLLIILSNKEKKKE